MKRLVCATLALSLLGAAAIPASAAPFGHGHYDRGYRHGGGNDGALIGLGIGLFALGAIAASQNDYDRDRYQGRYYEDNYRTGYRGHNDGYGYRYR